MKTQTVKSFQCLHIFVTAFFKQIVTNKKTDLTSVVYKSKVVHLILFASSKNIEILVTGIIYRKLEIHVCKTLCPQLYACP